MIIKIGSNYEVDVSFVTKEIHDVEIEYYGDQKITTPITTLKIIGWLYNTEKLTKAQQEEVEIHLKEYILDIEDLLN